MKSRIAATFIAAGMAVSAAEAQTPGRAPTGSFELGVDGMAWWFKDTPVPVPLVTNLIAGAPETQTYLGGAPLSVGTLPGARIAGSYVLSDRSTLEGNFLFVPDRSTTRSVSSSGQIGSVNLIVPYLDANSNQENGTEISFAPIYSGSATEKYTVGMLGAEVNDALTLSSSASWTVEALGGGRYLRLHETLAFMTSSPTIGPFPAGAWATLDRFETSDDFYGLQAGLRARYDRDRFFGTGTVKLALGAMVQSVAIQGSLLTDELSSDGSLQTFAGGYFALPSNIGSNSRAVFSVVPEVDVRFGYRLSPALSILVGYSFFYASNVVRPGNQIDRTVNPTQSTSYTENPVPIPEGPARPSFSFRESSFWAQGANLGFSYRF